MLQLCRMLHAQLSELQQGEGALECSSAAGAAATQQRVSAAARGTHALLASQLQPGAAAPLLVFATLAAGKLPLSLLQLLAHRSMRELAAHACVADAALDLAALLARAPGLAPLLAAPLRFSNEETSLAQALAQSAQHAAAALAAPAVAGGGGAARVAARVLEVHQAVEAALAAAAQHRAAAAASGGDEQMREAGPSSPPAQQPALGGAAQAAAAGGAPLRSPVCAALAARSAVKRPASTELEELGRALGVAARASPVVAGGRSTPDWPPGSPAAVRGASAAAASPQQQQMTPPRQTGGQALSNVVLESARRLTETLHVSPPVSSRAASSAAGSPTVPLALSRLQASGSCCAPAGSGGGSGAAATASGPSSPSATRLMCDEAPLEFVDSPSRPGTGLLGLFSTHIPTCPPTGGAPGAGRARGGGAGAGAGAQRGMGGAEDSRSPSPRAGAQPWGTPTTGQHQSSPEDSTWGSPGSWGPGEDGGGTRLSALNMAAAAAAAAGAAAAHAAVANSTAQQQLRFEAPAGGGGDAAMDGTAVAAGGDASAPPHMMPSCVLPLPISSLSSRLAAMQAGGLISGPSPNRAGGPIPANGSPLRRSSAAAPLAAWPEAHRGEDADGCDELVCDEEGAAQAEAEGQQLPGQRGQQAAPPPPRTVVQVSFYGHDGAVSLLDPGFLRPDSPMCMEVPATAAAAAAWAAAAAAVPSGGAQRRRWQPQPRPPRPPRR